VRRHKDFVAIRDLVVAQHRIGYPMPCP
jgi:hypothetical protein